MAPSYPHAAISCSKLLSKLHFVNMSTMTSRRITHFGMSEKPRQRRGNIIWKLELIAHDCAAKPWNTHASRVKQHAIDDYEEE
jgi:hypothetical protein